MATTNNADNTPLSDERIAEMRSHAARWLMPETGALDLRNDLMDAIDEIERQRICGAQSQRVIAALERHVDKSADYHHQLVRRLADALEIVRAVAKARRQYQAPGDMVGLPAHLRNQSAILIVPCDLQERASALLTTAGTDEAQS